MGKIEDFIESHTIKPMFPKPLFCFAVLKQNAGRHQHTSSVNMAPVFGKECPV